MTEVKEDGSNGIIIFYPCPNKMENNNNNNNNISDMGDWCSIYFPGISTCQIVWLDYFASPLKERHKISNLRIF